MNRLLIVAACVAFPPNPRADDGTANACAARDETASPVSVPVGPERPMTGKALAEYQRLDEAVLSAMKTLDATAATVAVSREGTLLYSRGYGWSDSAKRTPTPVDALMRIASVSKPITAAEVQKLIRDGKLAPDTKVFPLLGIKPYSGKYGDPRFDAITVQHLLDHRGGWDREASFDPMFAMGEIARALRLKGSVTPVNVIEFMLAQPLQFAPGERSAYSNFGYCVLGRVIERVTGKSYSDAVEGDLLRPLSIADLKLGRDAPERRDAREVWYAEGDGTFCVEVMDAHGGWIASAPALCSFMDAYWISGEPRDAGERRPASTFNGSLPGTSSLVRQRSDGLNVAALFNNRTSTNLGFLEAAIDKALGAPGEDRYAAIWEKRGGPSWEAQHDVSAADYQREFDARVKKGFRLRSVRGYEVDGETRYATIWEKRKGEWKARHELDAAKFRREHDDLERAGYRPVWIDAHTVSGKVRYAAIWERGDGPECVVKIGLSDADFVTTVNAHHAAGYRPICVSAYASNGEGRYAGIWEKRGGEACLVRHGLSAADYQRVFDEYQSKGFRLIQVNAHRAGDDVRFAGIWERSDGTPWAARHHLVADEYQREFDKHYREGYRLICVSGYAAAKPQ